ncbi:hypothetical protein [Corallococcus sp. AB045]|uniref:hypothetical protein n=1 Tax=Corallococcus sp. AB045 TaxID=2316719 RepID=UPI0013155362|nr:hypothetical protein [Corallococcus sp. AB045]
MLLVRRKHLQDRYLQLFEQALDLPLRGPRRARPGCGRARPITNEWARGGFREP